MQRDRAHVADAVAALLKALGHPPDGDPLLAGTPRRVADAWLDELLDGYEVDAAALLARESEPCTAATPSFVVVQGLAVTTVCPHHLLPARGVAAVAYLPGERLAGIGALAQLVDAFAHRLTLQETIGTEVARALVEHLGARGAACRLSLSHDCLSARGERQTGARVETVATAGTLASGAPELAAVLAALGGAP